VAEEEDGDICGLGLNVVVKQVEVREVLLEPIHVGAPPFGAAVSALIVGVHRGVLIDEGPRHVIVSATVLGVAVNQQDDRLGVPVWQPVLRVEGEAIVRGE